MYKLYIANKNYSSWSLRPWVLMSELRIAFEEHLLAFGHASSWQSFRKISPSGKVPCLVDGQLSVWDSLAIAEYLAERHAGIWPANASARAWARCAAAEMHAGFTELRTRCSMTCGVRIRLKEIPRALEREIARMSELWNDGLRRFGGPFLAGESFTAADAFFAPVAFRAQTYNLALDAVAAGYVARILDLRSMRRWYMQALEEKLRDEPHEADMLQAGSVLQDLRAT
ncbi:MAG: glutathione S-transferase N-terminal domain-containing protein [Steroidobacterales bacterium]